MGTDPALIPVPEAPPVSVAAALPVGLLPVGSLDQILAADDLGREDVPMPEWGLSVTVRGLGYAEWADLRTGATVAGEIDEKLFMRNLIAAALVAPAVTPEQASLLMAKSVPAVDRLGKAVLSISHIGEDSVAQAEATFQS
jgi:hypothetical protein